MFRAEDDLPVTGLRGLALAEEQLDLGRAALVELGGTVLAEHLEDQAVGVAGGDRDTSMAPAPFSGLRRTRRSRRS